MRPSGALRTDTVWCEDPAHAPHEVRQNQRIEQRAQAQEYDRERKCEALHRCILSAWNKNMQYISRHMMM